MNKLPGYSLIEIIIVITLFVIISIAVTTSYVSFEGRERLKNAALQVKNDIRLVQSKAQSGDKGIGACAATSSLAGWYITLNSTAGSNTSYTFAGDCANGANFTEAAFSSSTLKLPNGVTISKINGSGNTVESVFFKPLDFNVSFHNSAATSSGIDFLTTTNVLTNLISPQPTETTITLTNADGDYEVKINNSGKVYDNKP